MNALTDRRTFPGVLLIVIGLVLLGAQWFEITGAAVLGAIAGIFLVAHASTRSYGFLIPGMIFAGLAVGVGLQESGYDPRGGFVVVGLGAAFIGIYLIDILSGHVDRWWPIIPGGILGIVGASEVAKGTVAADAIANLWPIALVLAGVVVLVGATRRRDTPPQPTPSQ